MALNGWSAPAIVNEGSVSHESAGRRCPDAHPRPHVAPRVVWLRGEHDRCTAEGLAVMLADAIAADDADLVVDLCDVTFMGAATVGVLEGLGEVLRDQGRTLTLRSPSGAARRVLDICGLSDLAEAPGGASTALASKAP